MFVLAMDCLGAIDGLATGRTRLTDFGRLGVPWRLSIDGFALSVCMGRISSSIPGLNRLDSV